MTITEEKKNTSRRDWFPRSAVLLGAGAVSSMVSRAQSTGATNDINLLNFALRLENLENAFYTQGLAMFGPRDFQNCAAIQAMGGTKIGANVYSYLSAIGKHEQDHVARLNQVVSAMGGTPQPLDCYNFNFTTAD